MDIIEKLAKMKGPSDSVWKSWSLEEKRKLLEIYLTISKKEEHIFQLIYRYHGEDSWEDIFRDYDTRYLEDKVSGVEIAVKNINKNYKEDEDGNEKYHEEDIEDDYESDTEH